MKKMKLICLKKRTLAAVGCLLAAGAMFLAVNHPAVVGAAASTRQLPIYCVEKDYKVLSISFDAAWGDVRVRRSPKEGIAALFSPKMIHRAMA